MFAKVLISLLVFIMGLQKCYKSGNTKMFSKIKHNIVICNILQYVKRSLTTSCSLQPIIPNVSPGKFFRKKKVFVQAVCSYTNARMHTFSFVVFKKKYNERITDKICILYIN